VSETYGFTYKGRHCLEFGARLLRYTVNSPQLRENEDTVAGLDGVIDYGTELGKREIEVVFDIDPDGRSFKRRQSQILSWLKPKSSGQLVFDDVPDRYFNAKLTGSMVVEQIGTYGEIRVTFKATDPYSYSTTESDDIILDSDVVLDEEITLDATWSFVINRPQTVTVNNWGYEEVRPRIVITGSWTTLQVGSLTYNSSANNKTLVIDCERESARIDGTSVNITGDFITLEPGNNVVAIGGTALNCTVSFEFRAKYL